MKNLICFFFIFITTTLQSAIYKNPTPQFKPRIEVSALFVEHENRLLLLHRQESKSQGNLWGIPGGKIDKEETPLQAAIRETKEETGFDFSNQSIDYLGTVYIEYNSEDHFIYHMFRTKLFSNPGNVKINFNEHKGFTWVIPQDALKLALIQDEDACFKLIYGL